MTSDHGISTTQQRQNQQAYDPEIPPGTPDDFATTMTSHRPSLLAPSTLRHVTRVSKRAALATKKQIWDSNDASIVAAQSAVDQWEEGYNAMRGLLGMFGASASGLYGAAKAGATGLEHAFLLPVRDWILLPAFGGAERIAGETIGFLQSEECRHLERAGLGIIQQVPFVGESILAPAVCGGAEILKRSWEIAQYPIPSPSQVRDSVDFVMTGTKWCLAKSSEEIVMYVKRADANITRTLSHTQWKVLGSGPYATLDKLNKVEVLDHLCERYFSLGDMVARYELAAHIRALNRPLYHDLVLTGLLRERGGALTSEDEWLSPFPSYRESQPPFLLEDEEGVSDRDDSTAPHAFPLWFRLPYHNGKRPNKATPWEQFESADRLRIERFYRSELRKREQHQGPTASTRSTESFPVQEMDDPFDEQQKYATNAKWYNPDLDNDLLLDQKRHAVSLFPCCPKCRSRHDSPILTPLVPKQFGELCQSCSEQQLEAPWVDALLSPPPLYTVFRPTMWRFYGPGDELRRAIWFLDTQRHGLQPYGEDAQAVLEDAYLFLKWATEKRMRHGSILLTVQVPSPDGSENQLVQFSSLISATAIGKGFLGAISLFKQRVYRGAYHKTSDSLIPSIETETDRDTLQNDRDENNTKVEELKNSSTQSRSEHSQDESSTETEPIPDAVDDRGPTILPNCEQELVQDSDVKGLEEKMAADVELDKAVSLARDENNTKGEELNNSSTQKRSENSQDESSTETEPIPDAVDDRGPTILPNCKQELVQDSDVKGLEEKMAADVELDKAVSLAFRLEEMEDETKKEKCADDDDETAQHLVLIVHGIGEMLLKFDLFGISKVPTIDDCCGFLRKNHEEVLNVRFSQMYQTLDGMQQPRRGRVEYLPIEWHEAFTIQSRRRLLRTTTPENHRATNFTINDVSMRTIPQLRQFANDTLMDVLYFMSPEHHDIIIDIVVNEMNFVVERFRKLTGFGGDVSVVGHSMGSIITWDILDNQREDTMPQQDSTEEPEHSKTPSDLRCTTNIAEEPLDDHPKSMSPLEEDNAQASLGYPQLTFDVDNAFMLGSPIAVFLMIRNPRKPLATDFALNGCSRVFNIFHPYDPVAYRIEPLLDPKNAEIEPRIMTHWHGGFRFQYQTKRLWRKIVQQTLKTQETVVEGLESGFAALGLLDAANENDDSEDDEEEIDFTYDRAHASRPPRVEMGSLNRGQRIDYMLQEREIEKANEYVAALAAHSCYWLEKDLSLFIARQICLRALERETSDGKSFSRYNSL